MTPPKARLSFIEKAGYSLGDGAANFVFMTMILFQLNFYTDTMGISAGIAGSMLLVGRLWDAFFDPMMGVLADRTNTRWGKFRPWVLWTAIPWGIVMVLAYTKPGFSGTGLILYAVVTNVLLMTLYSANNTPYSAMSGVMTGDGNERTVLSSYRFVSAMLAQLIVGGFTLPFVAKFGHGNNAVGWQKTMTLWAVVCVVCFLITFLTTKERIEPPPQQKSEPKADFQNLLKNAPWIAMFIVTLSHFIFVAMRGGTMNYYFNYYLDQNRLLDFLRGFGLPQATAAQPDGGHYILNALGLVLAEDRSNLSSVGFSLFNILSQGVTLIGVAFATMLAMRFGKRGVALAGFALTAVFQVVVFTVPATSIGMVYGLEVVRALSYAPTIPLLWAMFADTADYSEWKLGRRATGVIFATILFALKTGLSLGGAFTGWILDGFGYDPKAITENAVLGIRLTASIFPAVFLVVVVICLVRYSITKTVEAQMGKELEERRRKYGAGVSAPEGLPQPGGPVVTTN